MSGFGMAARPQDPNESRSPGIEQRYDALLEELGGFEEDYPLPEMDVDARKLVGAMADEYARRKADGTLPAKLAQIHYASLIAQKLGFEDKYYELPRPLRSQVADFIEQHKEAYRLSFREADGSLPGPR